MAFLISTSLVRSVTILNAPPIALDTWRYTQATGRFDTAAQFYNWVGYAGTGIGRNNPDMQGVRNVGPLPVGTYRIGPPSDHPRMGPCTMFLDPIPGTDMLGRSGFFIHGDNIRGDASRGCIVLPRHARETIAKMRVHRKFLVVIDR